MAMVAGPAASTTSIRPGYASTYGPGSMRAVVQRVTWARVRVDGEVVGAIGPGLCVLLGVTNDDDEAVARKLAEKLWHLRVLADDEGVMNRSLAEAGGGVLVVSQFTLYGDTSRGRRPSWVAAARPEHAEPLVEQVVARLRALDAEVATGRFRTHMLVELENDGPVTVLVDVP
jgi:D-tyrosyl-tRNA(Tyr) deacylase